ncbi:MAG TPA: hypothetical protein VM686_01910 [Polyangiaceae bacterium]|nr:hypothetical protein [Polyangiaceae bacterium]
MAEAALLRFLELVQRELAAEDAWLQLGGAEPSDERLIWQAIGGGSTRVVLRFAEAQADRSGLGSRLSALCTTFRTTIDEAASASAAPATPVDTARQRLDEELGALAQRAGASRAFVFDLDSPVIWGASIVQGSVGTAANQVLERAVVELREQRADELRRAHGHTVRLTLDSGEEALARPFASIYVLTLLFSDPVSEPIALGAMLHAVGVIERLVLALPPVDPDPGAKILRLPRRR